MTTFEKLCYRAAAFYGTVFGRAHPPRRHSWRQVNQWLFERYRADRRSAA